MNSIKQGVPLAGGVAAAVSVACLARASLMAAGAFNCGALPPFGLLKCTRFASVLLAF